MSATGRVRPRVNVIEIRSSLLGAILTRSRAWAVAAVPDGRDRSYLSSKGTLALPRRG